MIYYFVATFRPCSASIRWCNVFMALAAPSLLLWCNLFSRGLDPTCGRRRESCKCLCDVKCLIWGVIDGLILQPATLLPPPTQWSCRQAQKNVAVCVYNVTFYSHIQTQLVELNQFWVCLFGVRVCVRVCVCIAAVPEHFFYRSTAKIHLDILTVVESQWSVIAAISIFLILTNLPSSLLSPPFSLRYRANSQCHSLPFL